MVVRGGGERSFQPRSLEMNYRFYWRLHRCDALFLGGSCCLNHTPPYGASNSWVLVGLLVGTRSGRCITPSGNQLRFQLRQLLRLGLPPLTSSWQWILRTLAALINRLHLENHKTFNWFPRLWSRLHSCNDPTLGASSFCNVSSRWRISVFFCGLARILKWSSSAATSV